MSEVQELRKLKRFTCKVCAKKFSSSSSLSCHKTVHNNKFIKGISCKHCERLFHSRGSLNSHKVIHVRTTFCIHCKRTFTRSSYLKHHDCRNIKPKYMCNLCGKRIKNFINYKKHIKKHTHKQKSFPCIYCRRVFSKDYLRRHSYFCARESVIREQ